MMNFFALDLVDTLPLSYFSILYIISHQYVGFTLKMSLASFPYNCQSFSYVKKLLKQPPQLSLYL